MKEENLVESQELREQCIERIEVLDKVGDLLLLPSTEFATVKMVAEYYGVGNEAVNTITKRHTIELQEDGYTTFKKDEVVEMFRKVQVEPSKNVVGGTIITFENNTTLKINNAGLKLLPKRAILRIGMLLRDSEVAKEVRTQLLNLIDNTYSTNKDLLVLDINEEKGLQLDLGEAYLSGDINKFATASIKVVAYKNRHIEKLENELNDITKVAQIATESFGVNCIDIEAYSKILGINGLGRNNMFAWLRSNKILKKNNLPYQTYMKYFEVIKINNQFANTKVLLNRFGVAYIYEKLIKDGYVSELSSREVLDLFNKLKNK